MARTYDDPCGVARALDLVGERWALLIVRELLLGPRTFRELTQALEGISPNLLKVAPSMASSWLSFEMTRDYFLSLRPEEDDDEI